MDYYYDELRKLQKEFNEVMHSYPLFSETIKDIEDKDIKEINELLDKNDEFYLKKAIAKLKDLIIFIKTNSESIKEQYDKFDHLANIWEKITLTNVFDSEMAILNNNIEKANVLIQSHDLNDLMMANEIMEKLINKYQ